MQSHPLQIGIMGVDAHGTLYTPSGRRLCRLPLPLAARIQRAQHFVSKASWKLLGLIARKD